MNTNLYNNLIEIANTNEAFFFKDFVIDGRVYRIFSHRLASYSDFLEKDALEARGIMFEVDQDGTYLRLASRPFHKFFNMNENPFTMNVDLNTIQTIELKVDGSLISTYYHWNEDLNPVLRVKSKGSVESTQAHDVMNFLNCSNNDSFKEELFDLAFFKNMTVILEWCSPENRVIINYDRAHLTVLAVRDNKTGNYYPKEAFNQYPEIQSRWIERVDVDNPREFVEQIPNMVDVEGYVVKTPDVWMKVKTNWYLTQHRAKDSVDSDRRLYEAVLAESTDDLRALFFDNEAVLSRIDKMERFVEHKYNHLVDVVERFYEDNKHLDRKDYAILGQKELDKMYFPLAMQKYVGKEVNYKDFMIKKWRDFGVKDNPLDED